METHYMSFKLGNDPKGSNEHQRMIPKKPSFILTYNKTIESHHPHSEYQKKNYKKEELVVEEVNNNKTYFIFEPITKVQCT